MKTRTYIPVLLSMLLFSVIVSSMVYSQDSLPAEKKRALSKFDPAEVFPQSGDRNRDNGRRRSANAESPSARDSGQAAAASDAASQRKAGRKKSPSDPNDQIQTSINPMPSTAVLSAVNRVPVPTPTATPLPVVTPPLPEAAPISTPTPEPIQTPMVASVAKSSDPPAAPPISTTIPTQSVREVSFSLPIIVAILSLILLALIVVIVKLKKQLSAP